uniref:Protein ZBED8like [Haplochromis burtoni] n=1 Tax=Lepeophtheirus salmonis TaxID=72036 RepID=A0A0K2V402_LEPSM
MPNIMLGKTAEDNLSQTYLCEKSFLRIVEIKTKKRNKLC